MHAGKKSPTGKHTCRKGLLSQVTENLYVKATSLKSSIPTNCTVRDQLLSFYVKNVFSRLEVGSDKLYFISAFQALQANMDACLGDQGIYKAIHELDILLPWIQAYVQTII
nr:interleukin-26 [Zonotrichia albicollis]